MKRKSILLSALTTILFSICFASCSQDDEMGRGTSAGDKGLEPRSTVIDSTDVKVGD